MFLLKAQYFHIERTNTILIISNRYEKKLISLMVQLVMLCLLFIPARSEAQVPISFGQMIASSIGSSGELDAYSFQANAGDVVIIRMTTESELDPEINLYDPDDSWIDGADNVGPEITEISTGPLPATGTYRLTASDCGNTETGDYWIFVQRLNNPGMASQIALGQTLPAGISFAHEVDTYTFDALSGVTVQIRMSTDTGLDPNFILFGPDGSCLDEAGTTGPDTAIGDFGLPADGTYTLLAQDMSDAASGDYGDETGNYWIFVQQLNNPGMATQIAYGETVQAAINSPHEVDTYTFDALSGVTVRIRMSTDTGLDPNFILFGPDGSCLDEASTTGPDTAIGDFGLPAAGTYTLLAQDMSDSASGDYGNETGNYWIFLQRLNNPGMATQIAFGETLQAAINSPHEVDTYTFDALAGDVIQVRMSTDTGLDPNFILFGPDGSCLNEAGTTGPDTAIGDFDLPTAGTYTLLAQDMSDAASGDYGDETGNYWIFVQRLNNPGSATQIAYGQTLLSSLESAYEVKAFTFDALSGDVVKVRMSTDTGLDVVVYLFDPEGTYLTEVTLIGPDTVETDNQELSITGTYTLLTSNYGSGKETGNYTISLDLIGGSPGSLIITPGEGLHASGLVGGPFSPLSVTYTLENNGELPIEWNLTKTQDWLDISSASGTLDAGSEHLVTASLNTSMVSGFDVGIYTDTLTFTNTTEANRTFLRSISLMVGQIEGILEVTPSDDFAPSGPPGGPFDPSSVIYTLENVGLEPMNWRVTKTAYWLSITPDHGTLSQGATVDVTLSLNEIAEALSKGIRTDTVAFANQSNGYGDTTREVTFSIGVSPSEITAELSKSSIILGELLDISGKIKQVPCDAGAWVDIVLISPGGEAMHRSVIANTLGEFSYSVACGDIDRAGSWTVLTSWNGDSCWGEATSEEKILEVVKAGSQVTLDVTTHAIKLGDSVSISGKFTPQPDCGGDLSGIPVTLMITGPTETDLQQVQTDSQFGHYLLSNYDGFNALGEWTVAAFFAGNDAYLASSSEPVNLSVVETAGYAIVIQGKHSSGEGLSSHSKTTDFVYHKLIERGLLANDIMYFNYEYDPNPNIRPEIDAGPARGGIQDAITIWARDKMNTKPANLYIVMVDHGFDEVFEIDPQQIGSSELDAWLDTLQATLTGQATDQEIVVILGFCRSGSFIDDLSGTYRVIIASAAPDESSYKGPLDEDGIREGEYFVSEFFKTVSFGKSIKECFQEAVLLTEVFTDSGLSSANAPYYDYSLQHPLLDDNGDGIGSNDLSYSGGDGSVSDGIFIGVSTLTGNDPGDVTVTKVAEAQFLGTSESTVDLWAKVDDNFGFSSIWVEVKAPDFLSVGTGGTGQAHLDLPKTVTTTHNSSLDRWEWSALGGFTEPGTYQVFYFAKDNISDSVSTIMQTRVYKAIAPELNQPPKSFSLVSPEDQASVLTTAVLDWEDTTDPNLDTLTYTVLLSKEETFNDPIRIEDLAYSTYLLGPSDGMEDLTQYYWKVQAIDEYGAIQESGVSVFNTNNTNPIMGWIAGHVYDISTDEPIDDADVSIGGNLLSTAAGGYYLGVLPPGNYAVNVMAIGYELKSDSVLIPDGALVSKDFGLEEAEDTDGDGMPDYWEDFYEVDNASGDPDGDGLNNLEEYLNGTLPKNPDSDSDGMPDGWEVDYGLEPDDDTGVNGATGDLDGDGYTNLEEYQRGTEPDNPDSYPSRAMPWLMLLLDD